MSSSSDDKAPNEVADEVKAAVDFRDVVAETHDIKKEYDEYAMVLCPFHDDTNPSMKVYREGWFYCFACDKGGDLIDWVEEIETVDFWDAIRLVVERHDLDISFEAAGSDRSEDRKTARSALKNALEYYREAFETFEESEPARQYLLEERNLSPETLEDFGVGYAPKGDRSYENNRDPGVEEEILLRVGILNEGEHGNYSPWEGRIIFPIRDHLGRPIGMAGRVMPGETGGSGKYINTPETSLYKKSRVLYGLSNARRRIRETGRALVVEGYTDVLRLHSAGVTNVVAICGTSFTRAQANRLDKVADRGVLVFDGDEAGRDSMRQALEKLLPVSLTPTVVPLPEDDDPADMVDEVGEDGAEKRVELIVDRRETGFVEFMRQEAERQEKMGRPEGRTEVQKTVATMIAKIDNRTLRREYIKDAAREMKVLPEAMYEMVQAARGEGVKKRVWEHFKGMTLGSGARSTSHRDEKKETGDGPSETGSEASPTGRSDPREEDATGSVAVEAKNGERSGDGDTKSREERKRDELKTMAQQRIMTSGEDCVSVGKRVAKKVWSRVEEEPEWVERLIFSLGLTFGGAGLELCRQILDVRKLEDRSIRKGYRRAWDILLEKEGSSIGEEDFPYENRSELKNIGVFEGGGKKMAAEVGIKESTLQEHPEGTLRGALAGWKAGQIEKRRKELQARREGTLQFQKIKASFEEERQLEEEEKRIERLIRGSVDTLYRSAAEGDELRTHA